MKGQTWSQYAFVLVVCALLMAGSFGLPHFGMSADMHGEGHMTMNDCYMPGMTAICAMNPLEHIASWQTMFMTILMESVLLLLFVVVYTSTLLPARDIIVGSERVLHRIRREYVPLHSVLQELYSRGILNPKVY